MSCREDPLREARSVGDDPFLKTRLSYNTKGVDFDYILAKNVRFEVTTPGQVTAHTNRFTRQGVTGYVWFVTYVR